MGDAMKVVTVVGTRPQFVKAAVVSRHLRKLGDSAPFDEVLVHTGQHYDELLSDVFFQDLELAATRRLDVGSAAPNIQLARVVSGVDEVLEEEEPDLVLVYGDTMSTVGAALAADHRDVPVAHVEAGERIFRRRYVPEESNRVVTDHLASLCLCVTQTAARYLRREGISASRIRFVGDPMYDLFLASVAEVSDLAAVSPADFDVEPGGYHLATIHRVENTLPEVVIDLLETLDSAPIPVLLPLHPRMRDVTAPMNWEPRGSLRLLEPLGYYDFLRLLIDCDHCVTDSGGVTREAFFAARPTVVPMENSWWPQATQSGWSVNVGRDSDALLAALEAPPPEEPPYTAEFGEGDAASRIVDALAEHGGREKDEISWHRHGSFAALPRFERTNLTYARYRRMLTVFDERGYEFAAFPDAEDLLAQGSPFLLLRHDVDMDVEKARVMAEIEAELDVRSTFFLMTEAEHYNIFAPKTSRAARAILDLGHRLGLHFDASAHSLGDGAASLAEACGAAVEALEQWFERPVEAVSFHRPGPQVLDAGEEVAPRPHILLPLFRQEIRYLSDSRGRWSHGDPLDSPELAAGRPLHILVHPIWWNEEPVAPYEALSRFVDRRASTLERSVAANCDVYRIGNLADIDEIRT